VTAVTALPRLGIVVVSYGSSELLSTNLVATAAGCPDGVVVVVDNFSTRTERGAVTTLCEAQGWTLVAPADNLGFGGGVNLGAAAAFRGGAEAILILNPDATIDAESVDRLRSRVAADPLTLVSPVVRHPDGRVWFGGSDLHLRSGSLASTRRRATLRPGPVETWLSGACLLVSRRLWRLVGGFDERYFLYWEDVDLSHRVREAGGDLAVVEEATAVHDEGGTQQRSGAAKSDVYYYYNIRNRLLFAALRLDPATRARWALTCGPAAYEILLRGGRRQFARRGGQPLAAAARGTLAGLRLIARPPTAAAPTIPARSDARPLVVLQSFPRPRPTTNPYLVMLAEQLEADPDVELRVFSWRESLTGRYDVFHAHWPEILVSGQSPAKKAVRQLLFLTLVAKWRREGTAIVRTLHNVHPPQGISRREALLLRLFERETDLFIRINDSTSLPSGVASETVPHGHYRTWFEPYARPDPVPGRVAYVGLVRRYKGVDSLVEAFRQTDDRRLSLTVGGQPSSPELAQALSRRAAGDPRIRLDLRFLPDEELVAAVSQAELVVLPYRDMHNSGTALMSLSLGRPILVPDNAVNRRLRGEVGVAWVHLYAGPLTAAVLEETLTAVKQSPSAPPDLSRRDWGPAGPAHVAAYRRALALAGRRAATPAPAVVEAV